VDPEKDETEIPEPDPAEDQPAPAEEEYRTALPPKVESWRKRSATGAVLTGLALGFQEALQKEREEPAIVMQTSGDPPKDLPVEADFEFRRPRHSVVNIRPWLVEPAAEPTAGTDAEEGEAEPPDPQP
jgi:hypothetical protein